jgi:hypothetical protein
MGNPIIYQDEERPTVANALRRLADAIERGDGSFSYSADSLHRFGEERTLLIARMPMCAHPREKRDPRSPYVCGVCRLWVGE